MSLSVSVVNLFLVFRVDNLTREGEMYQNLCFLLNFANCIISLAWSGEERWVRMRSWERLGVGENRERRVSQDVNWENKKIVLRGEKRKQTSLWVSLGCNWWLCLSHWAWMALSVYFDCLTRLRSIARGPAVNEWWHMFDAWLSQWKLTTYCLKLSLHSVFLADVIKLTFNDILNFSPRLITRTLSLSILKSYLLKVVVFWDGQHSDSTDAAI